MSSCWYSRQLRLVNLIHSPFQTWIQMNACSWYRANDLLFSFLFIYVLDSVFFSPISLHLFLSLQSCITMPLSCLNWAFHCYTLCSVGLSYFDKNEASQQFECCLKKLRNTAKLTWALNVIAKCKFWELWWVNKNCTKIDISMRYCKEINLILLQLSTLTKQDVDIFHQSDFFRRKSCSVQGFTDDELFTNNSWYMF